MNLTPNLMLNVQLASYKVLQYQAFAKNAVKEAGNEDDGDMRTRWSPSSLPANILLWACE